MFQPVHLAVKDPLAVADDNPRIEKCRIGHSVRQQSKIDHKKCSNAFININDRKIQNILSSTLTPTLPAPNLNIKTQQPFAIADSGSDSTLLRHSDAVVAQLNIEPTPHPLQVRFPDAKNSSIHGHI